MAGIERRDLLGAGRGAANVHSALLAENRRAARDRAVVGDVSDPDSGNVYKSFHPFDLRFYGSIGVRGPRRLLDPLKGFVASVNDFFVLTGRAIRSIFRSPHYSDDIFMQMDVIGVGSLMIAGMTGFFGGAVTRASVFDPLLRLRHRRHFRRGGRQGRRFRLSRPPASELGALSHAQDPFALSGFESGSPGVLGIPAR